MNNESFNKYIEQAIKENWERIALSDFDGVSYHYKDIARKIAKIHLLLESAEIKKGDKIAICGKSAFLENGQPKDAAIAAQRQHFHIQPKNRTCKLL